MPVITIARQYGSLGDEIGRDVSEHLGLRLVDNEIISEVAQRLGVPVASLNKRDERGSRLVSELVRTMQRMYPATLAPAASAESTEVEEGQYLQVIRQVLWEVARTNHAVIIGRAGTFILAQHPEITNLLVVAPLEIRVERIMAAEGIDHQRAVQRIQQVDSDRTRYIRHFYRANWLDVNHYDMVLNTGHFSQVQAVSLVCSAVSTASEEV